MFDYHLHSRVSFDSECAPSDIVTAAERKGLKEICFTDHYDFNDIHKDKCDLFSVEDYRSEYDSISSERVKIRRGVKVLLAYSRKRLLKITGLNLPLPTNSLQSLAIRQAILFSFLASARLIW